MACLQSKNALIPKIHKLILVDPEPLNVVLDALAEKEHALTAADEARRLRQEAARAKSSRKNGA